MWRLLKLIFAVGIVFGGIFAGVFFVNANPAMVNVQFPALDRETGEVSLGIALLGVEVSPWMAAWLALTLWTSAFLTEIWRGCVESLPRGQWEASSSLALSYIEQMRYVIVPQAWKIAN